MVKTKINYFNRKKIKPCSYLDWCLGQVNIEQPIEKSLSVVDGLEGELFFFLEMINKITGMVDPSQMARGCLDLKLGCPRKLSKNELLSYFFWFSNFLQVRMSFYNTFKTEKKVEK